METRGSLSRPWKTPGLAAAALAALLPLAASLLAAFLLAASLLAPSAAQANPHVWVEASMAFDLEDHRVRGLTFTWRFDATYSSHVIRSHDRDRDGVLGPAEMQALRADTFDPLVRFGYHVHLWAGGGKREDRRIHGFTARIEERRLVIEFSMPVTPPADPGEEPVVVSLFDPRNVIDFSFRKPDFLRVAGGMKPGCRFRVARGRGEQSGHPRPVTLRCEG